MTNENLVISENVSAFKTIFKIEVGLREMLIKKLGNIDQLWWKHRLPGDVLKKFREGKKEERNNKWSELIPHHPIYYIDFPDLRKIIEQNDNWQDVFQEIFSDKDIVCSMLREIEPIRNKVAHNRKISSHDLEIVESIFQALANSIGEIEFEQLIKELTIAKELKEKLEDLRVMTSDLFRACKAIQNLPSLGLWDEISRSWWFDNDYLGSSVEQIKIFFRLLIDYSNLPRSRGTGYMIEDWLNSSDIEKNFSLAQFELNSIIKSA